MNRFFIRIGNPKPCLRRAAAAGTFLLKKAVPFLEGRVLGPQALFTAEHAAAGVCFLLKTGMAFSGNGVFL